MSYDLMLHLLFYMYSVSEEPNENIQILMLALITMATQKFGSVLTKACDNPTNNCFEMQSIIFHQYSRLEEALCVSAYTLYTKY